MKECKAVGLGPPPTFSSSEDTPWPDSVSHLDILPSSEERFDLYIPMHTVGKALGLMYALPGEGKNFSRADCRLIVAFTSNGATLLERQRLLEEETQAKSLRESEKLKSILFSSISHNLKTPISSLSATLSSICQEDVEWDQKSFKRAD